MHNKIISINKKNILDECLELSFDKLDNGVPIHCIYHDNGDTKTFYISNNNRDSVLARGDNMWDILIQRNDDLVTIIRYLSSEKFIFRKSLPVNQISTMKHAFLDKYGKDNDVKLIV